jgi:multimeric flavodoxin WrbA
MLNTALIINGTIRSNGNTDILINKFVEGSTNAGWNIKHTKLRKEKIANCIGCYQCMKGSACSLQDDMTIVRDDINKAECIVFASPLYWWGVTGLMKTFIDRLFFYYHSQNKRLISGKKAIVITPMAEKDVDSTADLLVEFYKRLCNRLEVNLVEMALFGGIMEKGAILNKMEWLDKAYTLGENLIS